MKVNQFILALCLGALPFTSPLAEPVQQTLKFKTEVLPTEFEIKPSKPWPTAVSTIVHNKPTDVFVAYTNTLAITSLAVDVSAKLGKDANLLSGKNTIPVEVTLGDKKLNLNPQKIHSSGAAASNYPLTVQPTGKKHPAGTYEGDVVLIFDAV